MAYGNHPKHTQDLALPIHIAHREILDGTITFVLKLHIDRPQWGFVPIGKKLREVGAELVVWRIDCRDSIWQGFGILN